MTPSLRGQRAASAALLGLVTLVTASALIVVTTAGCSVIITGSLVKSQGKGQAYEIQANVQQQRIVAGLVVTLAACLQAFMGRGQGVASGDFATLRIATTAAEGRRQLQIEYVLH